MVLLTVLLAVSALLAPSRAYVKLPDDALRAIASGGDDWDIESGSLLSPILIPRVPGTPGSARAQQHFVDFFRDNLPLWSIDWHNSTSKTPATGDKDIPFSNLIFRRDPPWAAVGDVSRLTLVAHYDTLYEPDGFIGAIDSAAPCAMLLQVARSLEDALVKKWDQMQALGEANNGLEADIGVQIVLLDGEEAWVKWTDTDSLYGSRALAAAWEAEAHPASSAFRTPLSSISLFLLLDLLGAANPHVPSYFATTHWAYKHMAKIEKRLRKLDILESAPPHAFLPDASKPKGQFTRGYVADDHIPFMQRGVEILHVIPTPFPPQWHRMTDDGDHLDLPTLRDWSRIVSAFAAEWMELGDHMPKKTDAEFKKERARAVHSADLNKLLRHLPKAEIEVLNQEISEGDARYRTRAGKRVHYLLIPDVNCYNLVVDRSTGQVKKIDFKHAEAYEEEKARLELEELIADLTEERGRGAEVLAVDGDEVGRGGLTP